MPDRTEGEINMLLFVNTVRDMRVKQRQYFKIRDRSTMIESMGLEKNVDEMLAKWWQQ